VQTGFNCLNSNGMIIYFSLLVKYPAQVLAQE
jgi:hypothetical protein